MRNGNTSPDSSSTEEVDSTSSVCHLSRSGAGTHSLGALFRIPRSKPLFFAFSMSEIGDGVTGVIVPLAIFEVHGRLDLVAIAYAGQLAASSVGALLGTLAVERFGVARTILSFYALRICLLIFLTVAGFQTAWVPIAVVVVYKLFGAGEQPGVETVLRTLGSALPEATAIARRTLQNLSAVLGPAVGAVALATLGSRTALLIDAASFVLAAAVVGFVASSSPGGLRGADEPDDADAIVGQSPYGRYIPRERALIPVWISALAGSCAVAIVTVAAIEHLDKLGAPDAAYGYALSAYAVGATLGLPLAGTVQWGSRSLPLIVMSSNVVYGGLTLLSIATDQWLALPLIWLVWGTAYGPEQIASDAAVVGGRTPGQLTRLYGFWLSLSSTGSLAGYLIVVALPESVSSRLLIGAAGIILFTVVPAVHLVRSKRTVTATKKNTVVER